jgi:DNA-binding response OmpR family regulator
MPDMDGWQVLRDLKENPETRDIPVIIVSILDDRRLGFSLGAADYMVKPVAKEVLLKRLQSLERGTRITRVLIVDNEMETVRSIGNALKEANYEVLTSYNSDDAIRSIKDFKPHLVVLSLTLPQLGGLDVIEFLKTGQDVKEMPLIVLTYQNRRSKS